MLMSKFSIALEKNPPLQKKKTKIKKNTDKYKIFIEHNSSSIVCVCVVGCLHTKISETEIGTNFVFAMITNWNPNFEKNVAVKHRYHNVCVCVYIYIYIYTYTRGLSNKYVEILPKELTKRSTVYRTLSKEINSDESSFSWMTVSTWNFFSVESQCFYSMKCLWIRLIMANPCLAYL